VSVVFEGGSLLPGHGNETEPGPVIYSLCHVFDRLVPIKYPHFLLSFSLHGWRTSVCVIMRSFRRNFIEIKTTAQKASKSPYRR